MKYNRFWLGSLQSVHLHSLALWQLLTIPPPPAPHPRNPPRSGPRCGPHLPQPQHEPAPLRRQQGSRTGPLQPREAGAFLPQAPVGRFLAGPLKPRLRDPSPAAERETRVKTLFSIIPNVSLWSGAFYADPYPTPYPASLVLCSNPEKTAVPSPRGPSSAAFPIRVGAFLWLPPVAVPSCPGSSLQARGGARGS